MHRDELDPNRTLGRRRTLQLLGAGLAATGLSLLVGCKENNPPPAGEKAPAAGGPAAPTVEECNAMVDDASRTLRKSLQYKPVSDQPDKKCSTCAQFTPEKFGACGGGCKLIPGPVKPGGNCTSWVAIGSPAGSAAPAAKTPI